MSNLSAAEKAAANAMDPDVYLLCTHDVRPCECSYAEARDVVEAVRGPIAEETALQLGRDALKDGLVVFLDRLVGPESTARLLAEVRADVLEAAAESWAMSDGYVSMKAGDKAEAHLRELAARFRHTALRAAGLEEGDRGE
jgi:hypothetical protein